jgi:hypothetical protein
MSQVSIRQRLEDADLLWSNGRFEGALLSVLIALSATARRSASRRTGDRVAFIAFMRSTHAWTLSVEHRGAQVDVDHLLYTWMRCEPVHTGALPPDIRFDAELADPTECLVRAGGAPAFAVLLSHGWYHLLVDAVRNAPINRDLFTLESLQD